MDKPHPSAFTVQFLFTCTLILAPSLSGGQTAAAESVCEPVPVQDTRIENRSSIITFPNGRQILIIGHIHGDRDDFSKFKDIVRDQSRYSKEDIEKIINQAWDDIHETVNVEDLKNANTLVHMKQDYDFLVDFLPLHPAFSTIADETSVESAKKINDEFPVFFKKFKEVLSEKGIQISEEKLNDLIEGGLGIVGPYFSLKAPAFNQTIERTGYESEDALSAMHEAFKHRTDMADRATEALGKPLPPWFQSFEPILDALEDADVNDRLDQKLMQELRDKTKQVAPSELQKPMLDFLNAHMEYLLSNRNRDDKTAENLVHANQNIILFLGYAHLKPLMARIKTKCLDN